MIADTETGLRSDPGSLQRAPRLALNGARQIPEQNQRLNVGGMMNSQQDNTAQASVAAILAAVSAEMSIAAEACGKLDDALGQILQASPPESRNQVMQELHMVDLLAQHITAVTDFTHRLALIASTDETLTVDEALSAITLGAVAQRLRDSLAAAKAG